MTSSAPTVEAAPLVNFSTFTNYSALGPGMTQPQTIRLGDLNGDGHLDFVLGYFNPGNTNVQVRFGLGNGEFDPSFNLDAGLRPISVKVADGNADGIMDIFTASQLDDAMSFIIGSGGGFFVPYQAYITSNMWYPRDVVIADFNSDGTNDFAVANFNTNKISVYLALGDDTFGLEDNYTGGLGPISIVQSDFNRDGKKDLAVANYTGNTISILLGYQDGTFAEPIQYFTGGGNFPGELAVDDFDHDGYPDLLMIKNSINSVIGMQNNQFGAFVPVFTNALPAQPAGLTVADFNGDGTNDYVATLYGGGGTQVRVFVGTNFAYNAAGDFTVGVAPASVDAGDLNGDQVPDLVVANLTSGSVSILLNRTPVANPMQITLDEDTTASFTLSGTTNVALNYTIVAAPTNGVLIGTPPDLTYDPDPDYYGKDTFTFKVDDGTITSKVVAVSLTVLPVNDPPTFSLNDPLDVLEDVVFVAINNWAFNIGVGPANESFQTRWFIVTNDHATMFAMQPYISFTGRLLCKPMKDSNGVANVTVILKDSGGTARNGIDTSTNFFTINVTPVNDPPSYRLGPNVTVDEDCGPQVFPNWVTQLSVGPQDEVGEPQSLFDFEILSVSNPLLFSTPPAIDSTGTLTFTPELDASGFSFMTVRVLDDGGTLNGGKDTSWNRTFLIYVRQVNNQPYFELDPVLQNQVVSEDSGMQYVSNFVAFVDTGGPTEAWQPHYFLTANDNPTLFATPPILRPDGTLIYFPRPNSNGTANVTVTMRDSGGTLYGGINSTSTVFTINVLPINDPPTIILGGGVLVREDIGPVATNSWARRITSGPPNEGNQTVSNHVVVLDRTDLFEVQPFVDPTGLLTFTPTNDAFGLANVEVQAFDDGPTGGPFDRNFSPVYKFRINILSVNDAPTFTLTNNNITVGVGAGVVTTNVISYFSPGPYNETNQLVLFQVANNTNANMFWVKPYILPNGLMRFYPINSSTNVGKSVTLAVRAMDTGGYAFGGTNVTPWFTNLTIQLTP